MASVVTVARSRAEVESLRERWLLLPIRQVHADIDFFLTVTETRREVIRPHVVLVEEDARPVGLFAGRLESIPLPASFGYFDIYRPRVRALTTVHGGVIGAEGDAVRAATFGSIDRSLRAREADVVLFPSTRLDTPTFAAASALGGFLRREHFSETRTHRRLTLPATYDEFLATRTSAVRASLRRHEKRLRRDFGDELRVEILRKPEDLERALHDMGTIAAKTYQRALGVAFEDSLERRALARLALNRDWFRACILYLGETPVAFAQGIVYERVYHGSTTGYDPAYRRYQVGIYVLARLIEHLCADPGIDALDYGQGDAEYKRHFSDESWLERDVRIFAPTARAVAINLARTGVLGAGWSAHRLLDHTGLTDAVKRKWRRRMTTATAAA